MKKILFGLAAVVLVVGLIGSAFSAFTSNPVDPTTNQFTSGNLVLNMANTGAYSNAITNTWKSPVGWAPGDKVSATLKATNTGSIDAHHIYFMFNNLAHTGGTNLMDKIIVTSITETFKNTTLNTSTTTPNQAVTVASQVGNHDSTLTLAEFAGFMTGDYGYYTVDDQSGDALLLKSGDKDDYSITIEFQFDPTADNTYMADTASSIGTSRLARTPQQTA